MMEIEEDREAEDLGERWIKEEKIEVKRSQKIDLDFTDIDLDLRENTNLNNSSRVRVPRVSLSSKPTNQKK